MTENTTVKNLVTYSAPPLEEVAIAVQFDSLNLDFLSVRKLYDRFSGRFPRVEEHDPLPPHFELFDEPQAAFQVNLVIGAAAARRYWFVSESDAELIQVQSDKFIRNWRKRLSPYPRAKVIFPNFRSDFSEFQEVIAPQLVKVNQLEITYFNSFAVEDGVSFADAATKLFCVLSPERLKPTLSLSMPSSEMTTANLRYVFEDKSQNIRGRLHWELRPALDAQRKRALRLHIMASGRPSDSSEEGLEKFLEIARDQIVAVFDASLTDYAKKLWGRANV